MQSYTMGNIRFSDSFVRALVEARRVLRETFGVDFEYWIHDDDWRLLEEYAPSPRDRILEDFDRCFGLPSLFGETLSTGEPLVAKASQDQSVVVMPMTFEDGLACLAVGRVAGNDRDLFKRFAARALTAGRRECKSGPARPDVNSYAEQLSHTFEELAWLRSLADHIDCCDVRTEIGSVADVVLTTLRDVVCAESLVLIRQAKAPDAGTTSEDALQIEIVGGCGQGRFSEDVFHQLVRQFDSEAIQHPSVHNDLVDDPAFDDMPHLRQSIVVRVAKGDHRFGWIVAVNRLSGESSGAITTMPRRYASSEHEFGTVEASLMGSAAVMLATHARNVDLFREKESLAIGMVRALASTIDARDSYTRGHSDRVARIAKRVAEQLGLDSDDCSQIHLGGLLHDIGKIGIRDDVLLKAGRLTDEEYAKIKEHPGIGYSMLKHLDQLAPVLPAVLHHHEWFDGSGYPHGLEGQQTPLFARITAVADAYDAMTSSRLYREAASFEKAEAILRQNAGKQWDPDVIDALFAALEDIHNICSTSDGRNQDPSAPADAGHECMPVQWAGSVSATITAALSPTN